MKTLLKSALTVLFFPFLLLNPQQSKAEGGCPKGLFPVGGGYCRNIICAPVMGQVWDPNSMVTEDRVVNVADPDAEKTLGQYKLSCPVYAAAKWGNTLVPKR